MLQENVLFYLEKNKGELVTGGEVAKSLGVSRNAVWKSINALREEGHLIHSHPNKGYVLDAKSDGLSREMILYRMKSKSIGTNLMILDTVDSTNLYLKSLPPGEAVHGMVVVANGQTGGRGRLNREFLSPAGEGIYMSILVKPDIPMSEIQLLTICSAVSVARALETDCNVTLGIKWVNDILINDKKLCGILTEASLSAEMQAVESVVIGIGINTGVIHKVLEEIATSIYQETGLLGIRNKLIPAVLSEFEKLYLELISGNKIDMLREYQNRLCILEERVEVIDSAGSFEIKVKGIDNTGALIGLDSKGHECRITAGEVKIKRRPKHA